MSYMDGVMIFAAYFEAHPDLPGMPAGLDLYGITSQEAALKLWNSLPSPEAEVLQDHDLVKFIQKFGDFTVSWCMSRKHAAIPTIKDGEVVWVLRDEFTPLGVF